MNKKIFFLPVFLIISILFSGCGYWDLSLNYSKTLEEGCWEIAVNPDGGYGFAYRYTWDGTEEGRTIKATTIAGYEIRKFGGFFGRGYPMPFDISVPYEYVRLEEIPKDAEITDSVFTLVLTKNIRNVDLEDSEDYYKITNEDGSESYYRVVITQKSENS